MNGLSEIDRAMLTVETVPEVRQKMLKAENLHKMIPEESVADLEFVDVSGRFYCTVKRLLDIIIAALALVVLLIPMAILYVIIYLDDPGKVIFSQYRVGRNGKRFKLYKFRSMKKSTPKYEATMELNNPNQYFTGVGQLLRKYSLDELPQLINVLKGDMSLIGPRPLISDEYEIHAMRMRFGVYNVRPGITGLAQINGRDRITPVEKLHWDVRYLQSFSFLSDVKILLSTIPKVLRKENFKEGR